MLRKCTFFFHATFWSLLLLLLLLLLKWHYSPMRTLTSLIDFSQSALFFDFYCQFVIFHLLISVYTVPPSVFWSSSQSTSLWTIVKLDHLFFYSPFY
jgi:hypothetical protein